MSTFNLDEEDGKEYTEFTDIPEIKGTEIDAIKPEDKPLPLPPKAQAEMNKRVGRPTGYNNEVAEYICIQIITTTTGLRKICSDVGISYETMRTWLLKYPEFAALYARAKKIQADNMFEEALEVSKSTVDTNDMAAVQMKRLHVDTLKWGASKLLPKVYGDKQIIENETPPNGQVNSNQFDQIIRELRGLNKPNNDGKFDDAEIVT